MRKRIEELFGEAKEFMGMRRAKFREQVLLTATAQNIKRMVRLLSRRGPHREAFTLAAILKAVAETARRAGSLSRLLAGAPLLGFRLHTREVLHSPWRSEEFDDHASSLQFIS